MTVNNEKSNSRFYIKKLKDGDGDTHDIISDGIKLESVIMTETDVKTGDIVSCTENSDSDKQSSLNIYINEETQLKMMEQNRNEPSDYCFYVKFSKEDDGKTYAFLNGGINIGEVASAHEFFNTVNVITGDVQSTKIVCRDEEILIKQKINVKYETTNKEEKCK